MKIKITSLNKKEDTGGGSTFIRNFAKGIIKKGYQIAYENEDYDILFVAGATLGTRQEIDEAKSKGKVIVLRVDNILEDSRNKNSGMARMKEFSEKATCIVYQSHWARRLLEPTCGQGVVIYNGVDTDIFYPLKTPKHWDGLRIFYAKHSTNEVKRFHEVQYFWRFYNLTKWGDTLVLAGRFGEDLRKIEHPFEFHNNEEYEYLGILKPEQMAETMRNCDLAFLPYFADACSNTILEAQACGIPVLYNSFGGSREIVVNGRMINWAEEEPLEMVDKTISKYKLNKEKINNEFLDNFSLEAMCEKYDALFKTINTKEQEL